LTSDQFFEVTKYYITTHQINFVYVTNESIYCNLKWQSTYEKTLMCKLPHLSLSSLFERERLRFRLRRRSLFGETVPEVEHS
jgi:hypothetical protein